MMNIRLLVLNGEFEPHSRLPEVALAERLGISRTPLRQAMARLVEEGLLERVNTGGYRVASFSIADIVDAIELRGVIESTAVRLAAERGADPELLAECAHILDELDTVVFDPDPLDLGRYMPLNTKFHELLSRLSGSNVIQRAVERATGLPLASPSAFLQGQESVSDFKASLQLAQSQHRAIYEAIVNREGTRAEAMTREHARLSRQNLEYVMKLHPEIVERLPGMALISAT